MHALWDVYPLYLKTFYPNFLAILQVCLGLIQLTLFGLFFVRESPYDLVKVMDDQGCLEHLHELYGNSQRVDLEYSKLMEWRDAKKFVGLSYRTLFQKGLRGVFCSAWCMSWSIDLGCSFDVRASLVWVLGHLGNRADSRGQTSDPEFRQSHLPRHQPFRDFSYRLSHPSNELPLRPSRRKYRHASPQLLPPL
jgi:hypothetical protein